MHSKTTSQTTLSENYSVYQNIGKTGIYSNDCSTVSLTLSLNQYDHTLFPIPSSIRDEYYKLIYEKKCMLEYKMQKKWISLFPHFRTIKKC